MNEAMVDIETLGTEPGCVILSIGATMFDPRGQGHGDTFYCNIDVGSSLEAGFTFSESTLKWWGEQSRQAVDQLGSDNVAIHSALIAFDKWYRAQKPTKFWCQGLSFDVPILEAAFKKFDMTPPWKFWTARDTRTAYDVCGFNDKSVKREGTYHNALADSIHQVDCVQKAMIQFREKVVL